MAVPSSAVAEIQRSENCRFLAPFCADILLPWLKKVFFLCHFATVFSRKALQTNRIKNIESEYVAFKKNVLVIFPQLRAMSPLILTIVRRNLDTRASCFSSPPEKQPSRPQIEPASLGSAARLSHRNANRAANTHDAQRDGGHRRVVTALASPRAPQGPLQRLHGSLDVGEPLHHLRGVLGEAGLEQVDMAGGERRGGRQAALFFGAQHRRDGLRRRFQGSLR